MKRFLVAYIKDTRFYSVVVKASNLWQAIEIFDAMDISVDEVLSVTRIPETLKL